MGSVALYTDSDDKVIPGLGVTVSRTSCPIVACEAEGTIVPPETFGSIEIGRCVQSSWMLLYSNIFQLEKYAICEPHGTNKVATGEMLENALDPIVGGVVAKEIIVFKDAQLLKALEGIVWTFSPIFTVTIGLELNDEIEVQFVA